MTECPYCGTRLRKRAPKLTRGEEGLTPLESRRDRRRRKRRERAAGRASGRADRAERTRAFGETRLSDRPVTTIGLIVVPAIVLLVNTAATVDTGAIAGPVGTEWWRYLTAPFAFPDVGYLFAIAVAVAIFGGAVEARLGSFATALLALAAGALGMLGADALDGALAPDGLFLAAGGNGVALGLAGTWAVLKRAEVRAGLDDHPEVIGAAIAVVALLALSLVEDFANVYAGIVGGSVGAACGYAANLARGPRRDG